jgi:hypothetical protein
MRRTRCVRQKKSKGKGTLNPTEKNKMPLVPTQALPVLYVLPVQEQEPEMSVYVALQALQTLLTQLAQLAPQVVADTIIHTYLNI